MNSKSQYFFSSRTEMVSNSNIPSPENSKLIFRKKVNSVTQRDHSRHHWLWDFPSWKLH